MNTSNVSDVQKSVLINGLKAFYAAELGIATASEFGIRALRLDKIAGPIVGFQRLNAAAQTALWAGLIGYLEIEARKG
jgi:hypothetical protein